MPILWKTRPWSRPEDDWRSQSTRTLAAYISPMDSSRRSMSLQLEAALPKALGLLAVTERNTRDEIDRLIEAFRDVAERHG